MKNLVKHLKEYKLMSIHVVKGDIFNTHCNIICHQVNCQGVMGHGIAKQVKEKYKGVFEEYKRYCDAHTNKADMLGEALIIDIDYGAAVCDWLGWRNNAENKFIANIFGQLTYGPGLRTDYKALVSGFESVADFAAKYNLSVAIPYKIGCGLAGGDWSKVSTLIEGVFAGTNIEVLIYRYEQNESYENYEKTRAEHIQDMIYLSQELGLYDIDTEEQ